MNRIGERNFNKFGSEMVIEKYINAHTVYVKFTENENLVRTNYGHFKRGSVTSPYEKRQCGVGYLGEGEYKTRDKNGHTKEYRAWKSMFQRCYSSAYHKRYPTYIGCAVDPLWHSFQTFAQWYDENYYVIEGQKMHLDKDILKKGNKVYSPETCIIVPNNINSLFVKANATRGDLPIGVSWHNQAKKFQVQLKNTTKKLYDTPYEAFQAYKESKEILIKQIANGYKNQIPVSLYEAMVSYVVEIND